MQKPAVPASTEGIQALADVVRGGGGEGRTGQPAAGEGAAQFGGSGFTGSTTNSFGDSGPTTGAASLANSAAAALGNAGLTGISNAMAANVNPNYGNEGRLANDKSLAAAADGPPAANPMSTDPSQRGDAEGGEGGGEGGVGGTPGSAHSGQGPGAGIGGDGGSGGGGGGDGPGSSSGSGGFGRGARGGYLTNGQFDQRYADGGVTGSGNIDLHVPINIGGEGGGGGGGGGGFGGGNNIQQGGMLQSPMGGLGGLLGQLQPQMPQAFAQQATDEMAQQQQFMQPFGGAYAQAQQQQQATQPMLQATQGLGKQNQAFGGNMGGMRYGAFADGGMTGMAGGGLGSLGGYSDGGRLLRGPGDGVSDSIPATIGQRQPARLADGEFVVPARIVSELGNGSTEAGARQLYAMMDRIQKGRKKTVGKNKVAANTRSAKHLPA